MWQCGVCHPDLPSRKSLWLSCEESSCLMASSCSALGPTVCLSRSHIPPGCPWQWRSRWGAGTWPVVSAMWRLWSAAFALQLWTGGRTGMWCLPVWGPSCPMLGPLFVFSRCPPIHLLYSWLHLLPASWRTWSDTHSFILVHLICLVLSGCGDMSCHVSVTPCNFEFLLYKVAAVLFVA